MRFLFVLWFYDNQHHRLFILTIHITSNIFKKFIWSSLLHVQMYVLKTTELNNITTQTDRLAKYCKNSLRSYVRQLKRLCYFLMYLSTVR